MQTQIFFLSLTFTHLWPWGHSCRRHVRMNCLPHIATDPRRLGRVHGWSGDTRPWCAQDHISRMTGFSCCYGTRIPRALDGRSLLMKIYTLEPVFLRIQPNWNKLEQCYQNHIFSMQSLLTLDQKTAKVVFWACLIQIFSIFSPLY